MEKQEKEKRINNSLRNIEKDLELLKRKGGNKLDIDPDYLFKKRIERLGWDVSDYLIRINVYGSFPNQEGRFQKIIPEIKKYLPEFDVRN